MLHATAAPWGQGSLGVAAPHGLGCTAKEPEGNSAALLLKKEEEMADEQQATQWAVMWEAAQWRGIPVPVPAELCIGKRAKNVFIFRPEFIFYTHSLQGLLFFISFHYK